MLINNAHAPIYKFTCKLCMSVKEESCLLKHGARAQRPPPSTLENIELFLRAGWRRRALVRELLVHVLVHERRLAHARVAEDDHLEQHLLPARHAEHTQLLMLLDAWLAALIFHARSNGRFF